MEQFNNLHSNTRELIKNYDSRIIIIGDVITSTYDILEDCRKRRTNVREDLKINFARTKSLRKKDFDCMVQDLQVVQAECENQIKETLRIFTNEYKQLASTFLESLTSGKIDQSIDAVEKLENKQKEIQNTLNSFRCEQEEIARSLKSFLENSERVRIKDFKKMVQKIRNQQQDRNKRIHEMRAGIADEHNQMRTIWNELPENKQRLRNEKFNHSDD